MRLSLQREDLLVPLQRVIGVVERKNTIAILNNVLLEVGSEASSGHQSCLSITGTDMEILLTSQSVIGLGEQAAHRLTLPGRKLIDIIKSLPEAAPIELTQDKDKVTLRSGRSRFTLSTLPANEFPSLDDINDLIHFNIKQSDMLYLLSHTFFSMAQQDVRYFLNGILLEITPSQIRTAATDGHRLAVASVDACVKLESKAQAIIPRKAALELMRLLEDSDKLINFSLGQNHIRFINPSCTFTSKLIDGRYPEYSKVIPKGGNKVVTVDRDEFKSSLLRSAILCNEKFHGIHFELADNTLRLHANNPEQEVAEEEISIDYSHEPISIGFNVTYLLDVLNAAKPGPIKMIFSDANSSVLIEEEDGTHQALFVVMPMRM